MAGRPPPWLFTLLAPIAKAVGADRFDGIDWNKAMKAMAQLVTLNNTDSPYTADVTETIFWVDTGTASVTWKAPPVANATGKFLIVAKSSSSNTLTLDGNGANINGGATISLTALWGWAILTSDGTQWIALLGAAGSGTITGAQNVGSGTGTLFRGLSGTLIDIKRLSAGPNITITNQTNQVVIEGPAPGETNTMSSAGGGIALFFQKLVYDLQTKSLAQGANISIVDNGSGLLTISATTAGEANTVTSVGTGEAWPKAKVGVDIPMKSALAGRNMAVVALTNELRLDAMAGYRSVVGGATLNATDYWLDVDASGGTATIGAAAVASLGVGKHFVIQKTDSSVNPVTFDPNSSELCDNVLTKSLTQINQKLKVFTTSTGFMEES